jgi:hypothetical protein
MRGWILCGLLCLGLAVPAAAGEPDVGALAGVYKFSFHNQLASGEKYDSEDIMEIVPLDSGRAYLRLSLQFANGHTCAFWGVTHAEGGRMVYRSHDPERVCELAVRPKEDSLLLEDKDDRCREYYCGMRGVFSLIQFKTASRRDIRYLARLKASREFKEALDEDAANRP